jgi:Flp pilus assembly protein TadD
MKLVCAILSLVCVMAHAAAPSDYDSDLKKMREASAAKDENGVIASAVRILGSDSKNLQALNALAVHYFNLGKFGMARIMILRALIDHADSPTLQNNMGVIYLSEGKQKQAMASFRKAMELQPNYPYASVNLGAIYLEFKDYKKASDALGVGFDAMKSDMKRGNKALDVANNLAVALSGSGDLDKSKEVFQKILRVDDQNPSTLYNYAVLLVARMKSKREGEKIISRLKIVADDSMKKRIEDLEKMNGTN